MIKKFFKKIIPGIAPATPEEGFAYQLKKNTKNIQEILEKKKTLHDVFAGMDDDFWFWLFTDGYDNYEIVRQVLPGMPDKKTQDNFTGRSGHSALSQAVAFYELSKDILTRNSRSIRDCNAVLDFGCGWGRIIRFFLKDVDASGLWGVDCLSGMINLCREKIPSCNFQVINSMPPTGFEAGTFDLIYLYSVFSHLSEEAHLAWMGEFKRILKPGGMVIATTRPRAFIEYCNKLSKNPALQDWQRGAANSFSDPKKALEDYDNGKFVHAPYVGMKGVLDGSFFGETCIPKQYIEKVWSQMFSKAGFISEKEHGAFDQDLIFAKK